MNTPTCTSPTCRTLSPRSPWTARQKLINRYGGDGSAPMALLELENLIDTTVNSEQWTGSPPPELFLIEKPEDRSSQRSVRTCGPFSSQ